MQLPGATRETIRVALFLARRGTTAPAELASRLRLPATHVSRAVIALERAGIARGDADGAVSLSADPARISFRSIAEAAEPIKGVEGCFVHTASCPGLRGEWCPVRDAAREATQAFLRSLERVSLGAAAHRLSEIDSASVERLSHDRDTEPEWTHAGD